MSDGAPIVRLRRFRAMNRTPRLCACLIVIASACQKSGVHGLGSSGNAPSQLSFGDVMVGQQRRLPLKITNDSNNSFDLVGAEVAPPFTISAAPITVEAGTTLTLDVVFMPDSGQAYEKTLTLKLTATDTPELSVKLVGNGLTAPPPDTSCNAVGCATGQACCSSVCVDTQSDPAHCGGCSPCNSGQTCVAGACITPTPPPPQTSCDNLTNPCPDPYKCCNHSCKDVSTTGGLCSCNSDGQTTFDVGTIIIPMDACYQRGIDITAANGNIPTWCNANAKQTSDDAPLKAYGLVFFLLRHQVTVYMAIDSAKSTIDGVDLSLGGFVTRTTPVQRYDWASGNVVNMPDTTITSIKYRGAPFIIDSSQHDRVLNLLKNDPDFAQFRSAANVSVHISSTSFRTGVARSLSTVPSRIGLLVPPNDTQNVDILRRYLASAGLDFAGAGGDSTNHGIIYDVLQQSDFLPDWDHSALKAGGYKLLWAPHWEGNPSTDGNIPAQLATIGAYVSAGNDLFAECAAIGTLEGFSGTWGRNSGHLPGAADTRFMTSSGTNGDTIPDSGRGGYTGPFFLSGFTSPFAQRGDFPFVGFFGAIKDFYPDPASSSAYKAGVVRYISASPTTQTTDLFGSIDLHAFHKGTVVYLAGHDYSYGGNPGGDVGVTAGSRLVLNTMFSLGENNICAP